jgi:hypothetical protein
MGRRRRRDDLQVSLFPFLSVLACVIGTLTLLLAALAIGRLGGQSLEQVRLAEQYHAARDAVAAGLERLRELEAQLRRSEQLAKDEEALGMRLAGLGLSLDISLEDLTGVIDLRRREAEQKDKKRLLEREKQRIATKVEERESELEKRDALQMRAPIVIDPSGLGREQRPYMIECRKDFIELHNTRGEWSLRVPAEEIAISNDLRKYMRRVRAIHNAIVIFLIRPDGVLTYNDAAAIANRHKVRNAKLPLPGEGDLDFTRLNAASESRSQARPRTGTR